MSSPEVESKDRQILSLLAADGRMSFTDLGKATDLSVAVGPLPTLSTMQFTISSTYADGKAGPSMPASLALTPAAPGQAPAGHDHGGGTVTTPEDQTGAATGEDQVFKDAVADATRGPSVLSILAWVAAGLALLAGVVMMWRSRHRASEDEEIAEQDEPATEPAATEDEKEPVGAGHSKWSFKG